MSRHTIFSLRLNLIFLYMFEYYVSSNVFLSTNMSDTCNRYISPNPIERAYHIFIFMWKKDFLLTQYIRIMAVFLSFTLPLLPFEYAI